MTRAGAVRLAVVALLIAALEIAVRTRVVAPTVIVTPSEMVAGLALLAQSGKLAAIARPTLTAVALALVVSIIGGLAFGLALHVAPRLRRALEPLLSSYYAIPIFVFYPVLIVLFGLGIVPLVGLGCAFGLIVVAVSLAQGLDRLPPAIAKTARLEQMSFLETAWRIRLPFALPFVMHGLKLSVAYAFIGVIGGEFILAPNGLGHAIAYAYNDFDNRTMYALMLFVVVLVTTINLALHAAETRLRRRRGLA